MSILVKIKLLITKLIALRSSKSFDLDQKLFRNDKITINYSSAKHKI